MNLLDFHASQLCGVRRRSLTYEAKVSADRPAEDYTPHIVSYWGSIRSSGGGAYSVDEVIETGGSFDSI